MTDFTELRRKAEGILENKPLSADDHAFDDIQSILHELNVRQVELELQNEALTDQNEALHCAHDLLKISQKKYVDLYDFAPVGYCTLDKDGCVLQANLTAAQQVGVTRSELLNTRFYNYLIPEDRDTFFLHLRQLQAGQDRQTCEVRVNNNSPIHAFLDSHLIAGAENGSALCRTTITDITSRKEVEAVKELVNEKNVLLKELYHRTKNNMQSIISLLSLQSKDIEDEYTLKIFRDTQNRIQSMALVHQKLYETENLAQINLREYILDLVKLLNDSHVAGSTRITVVPDMEDILVSIDEAVPCGLVVNELLSNCFKYAFATGSEGRIKIGLHQQAETIEIFIGDDGVGVRPGVDLDEANTLGLRLVRAVVRGQLRGTATVETDNGVAWTIRFPLSLA